jgi:hypothetical protein
MPKITVTVNAYELRLIRRLARHEGRSVPLTAHTLMHMTMQMVRCEERTGLYYGPAPVYSPLQGTKPHKFKHTAACSSWTKEQRDTWILTGEEPA